jgi:hypothetical protein
VERARRDIRLANGVAFKPHACILCLGIDMEIEMVNAGFAIGAHIPVRGKRAVSLSIPGVNGSA